MNLSMSIPHFICKADVWQQFQKETKSNQPKAGPHKRRNEWITREILLWYRLTDKEKLKKMGFEKINGVKYKVEHTLQLHLCFD